MPPSTGRLLDGTAAERLQFRRAQLSLGTLVSISIGGLSADDCRDAAERGFSAVRTVHRLMSFHEQVSDIGQLNRYALGRDVEIHPLTVRVLKCALKLSELSGGTFDVSVAGELVAQGLLPRPQTSVDPAPNASWRDIELSGHRVRFHRPLWIDLGGIAKGFAVDYAFERMNLDPDVDVCVAAGGDLRVQGDGDHAVRLRTGDDSERIPVLFVSGPISIASSGGDTVDGTHIHGIRRTPMGQRMFVTVMARECMIADALTKVAMAGGNAEGALRTFGATALVFATGHVSTFGVLA